MFRYGGECPDGLGVKLEWEGVISVLLVAPKTLISHYEICHLLDGLLSPVSHVSSSVVLVTAAACFVALVLNT